MEPDDSPSFTSLATISLPEGHVLHPNAANPGMDLVALLSPVQFAPGQKQNVSLWRMSGSKVWDAKVDGRVVGLAWNYDGLFLSLVVIEGMHSGLKPVVTHLSVHDGSIMRSIPIKLDLVEQSLTEAQSKAQGWWEMEWKHDDEDWPKPAEGSSLMILDALPRVTPVDPPKPANAMLFMHLKKPPIDPASVSRHTSLSNFPSLLPIKTALSPDTLFISSPVSSHTACLLTGTYASSKRNLRSCNRKQTLMVAKIVDKVSDMLDVVLKGIEAAQHAVKEGTKQTMIWREELETCGEQQGMTKSEVHAALFRLLMTGRAVPAVSEWLGNRLTGRTVTKWEETMSTSFKDLQKVISQSITPALERIILLLADLRGKAKQDFSTDSAETLEGCIELAKGLAHLCERIRQDASHEALAAVEWIKWLNYEISRSVVQDQSTDASPSLKHDIKLVWAFMKTGFISSSLLLSFPQLIAPTKDVLASLTPQTQHVAKLDNVLRDTYRKLNGTPTTPVPQLTSPSQKADESVDSSVPFSDEMESDHATPSPESPLIPSSPDTVDDRPHHHESEEVKRVADLEPQVWANTLVKTCQEMVNDTTKEDGEVETPDHRIYSDGEVLFDRRAVEEGGGTWVTSVLSDQKDPRVLLCHTGHDGLTARHYTFESNLNITTILDVQFYDDVELALHVLVMEGSRRTAYLITVDYSRVRDELTLLDHQKRRMTTAEIYRALSDQQTTTIPIFRSRKLEAGLSRLVGGTLALNGRQGRRVGCVLISEDVLEVLDMEDSDDEGMDYPEGESGMEGVE